MTDLAVEFTMLVMRAVNYQNDCLSKLGLPPMTSLEQLKFEGGAKALLMSLREGDRFRGKVVMPYEPTDGMAEAAYNHRPHTTLPRLFYRVMRDEVIRDAQRKSS